MSLNRFLTRKEEKTANVVVAKLITLGSDSVVEDKVLMCVCVLCLGNSIEACPRPESVISLI